MHKVNILVVLFFVTLPIFSQAKYETISSQILGQDRELKILLPRGYSEDSEKAYPVIYVFDGDYLFEAVAGNTDYYAYWEDIPESIVVGINQVESRQDSIQNRIHYLLKAEQISLNLLEKN